MTLIYTEDLAESIADALQFISYYHPSDFIEALKGISLYTSPDCCKECNFADPG